MIKHIKSYGLLLLGCVLVSACAHGPESEQGTQPLFDTEDRAVMNSEGFLRTHPDLRWRRVAVQSLQEGRETEALAQFKRAARYADKPSQAMIAEMLWIGRGVAVNRPLAYAWMDIAAERAYIPFVAKREQYWAAMTADERKQALDVGRALYDEYNDSVAKPRLAKLLKREKRNVTGSRTGFVGFLQVVIPGPGGTSISIDGANFYDDKFWEPEQYFALQDSIWKDPPPRTGIVTVLPLEKVEEEGAQETPPDADDGTP